MLIRSRAQFNSKDYNPYTNRACTNDEFFIEIEQLVVSICDEALILGV